MGAEDSEFPSHPGEGFDNFAFEPSDLAGIVELPALSQFAQCAFVATAAGIEQGGAEFLIAGVRDGKDRAGLQRSAGLVLTQLVEPAPVNCGYVGGG